MSGELDSVSRELFDRLSEREDAEIGALNDLYRAALEQTIERVTGDLPRDEEGRLVPDPGALARLRRSFERFGDSEGASLLLEQHVERVSSALSRQVEVIGQGWARLGEDPLTDDELALSQLVRASWLDQMGELSRYHHAQLRDAVMRQALARSTPHLLRSEMWRLSRTSAAQADRMHHDALIGYSRSVIDESSTRRGFEYFEYRGPDDSANRPFCDKHVGKIYTREEIEKLDNGQTSNVMLTGGGYRCRHHWRPVKREWLDDELWKEKRARVRASVSVTGMDIETQWDRDHPLDYDALVEMSPEEADDYIREWFVEVLEVWTGPFGTPETRRMANEWLAGEISIVPLLTRDEFEDIVIQKGWKEADLDDLSGIAYRDEVYFPIEGSVGLLSILTHETTHVLDFLDNLDDPYDAYDDQLEWHEVLWEEERRAWLAEEEFRVNLGEDALWPGPDGLGIDEDAMMEFIRKVY